MDGDKINKLIRTAEAKETALNLENDTEQKRKIMTVIPNELILGRETGKK